MKLSSSYVFSDFRYSSNASCKGALIASTFFFLVFFFNDGYVFPVLSSLNTVNILPAEGQDVSNPQGGIESQHNKCVISGFVFNVSVVVSKLF